MKCTKCGFTLTGPVCTGCATDAIQARQDAKRQDDPYYIGVDPDMHQLSFMLINGQGRLVDMKSIVVNHKLTGRDALMQMSLLLNNSLVHYWMQEGRDVKAYACEAQEIYQHGSGRTKNPRSIMLLATVAGMALHHLRCLFPSASMYFPAPVEWKGNIPKRIHHGRICSRQGWKYTPVGKDDDGYCVPTLDAGMVGCSMSKGTWKHSLDSLGLAEYAKEQHEYGVKRALREIQSQNKINAEKAGHA